MKKLFLIAIALFAIAAANKEPMVVNSKLDPIEVAEKELAKEGFEIPPTEARDVSSRTNDKEKEEVKLISEKEEKESIFYPEEAMLPPIFKMMQRDMDKDMDKMFHSASSDTDSDDETQPRTQGNDNAGITNKTKSIAEVPFMAKLLGDIFSSFIQEAEKSLVGPVGESGDRNPNENIFGLPRVHDLPANYKNETSQVHQIGKNKVVVNQTIHKKSKNGKNEIFVFKLFNVLPRNKTHQEADLRKDLGEKKLPKIIDNSLNEIPEANISETKTKEERFIKKGLKREERSIQPNLPGNKEIIFPSNHLPNYPRSWVNSNVKTSEKSPTSKSFVYKDIGGKKTFYIINHKNDIKDVADKNPDSEVIGPLRKPDLSRDTLVNPSGGNGKHQGLIQVDPDSELFDLNLLIKEIESRPKKN